MLAEPALITRAFLIIGILAITCSLPTAFAQQSRFPEVRSVYGDVQLAYAGVRHSAREFNPGFASGALGYWLLPGVGVELFADRGLSDARDGEFSLEIVEASGLAARFQGPLSDEDYFAYMAVGLVFTRLEQFESEQSGQRTVVQNYRGGRLSLGGGRKFSSFPGALTLEYRNYFVDEALEMDALTFGVQVWLQ